jgi:hypothetical protein
MRVSAVILAINEAKRRVATDSQAKSNVRLPDMEHRKTRMEYGFNPFPSAFIG